MLSRSSRPIWDSGPVYITDSATT